MKSFLTLIASFLYYHGIANTDSIVMPRTHQYENRLQEVTVSAGNHRQREQVTGTQMGRLNIPVSLLLNTPAIAGERDIVKSLQLTPGIKRGTEGSIGMFVRGGGQDENLILLDGAPIYNAGHLLGFFSVFNGAAIRDAEMYKAAFPAQYGGRLSSVLDVRTKEGSFTTYKSSASISMISSAITVDGPILRDKLSAMVSLRRTYVDQVLRYIPYHFYDANIRLTYKPNSQYRISLSTYSGADIMRLSAAGDERGNPIDFRTGMRLGNRTASLMLHYLDRQNRFVAEVGLIHSRFGYQIDGKMGETSLSVRSAICDYGLKGQIKFYGTGAHKLSNGFAITHHSFNPNIMQARGTLLERYSNGQKLNNLEWSTFFQDDYKISNKWQATLGARISGTILADRQYVNPEPRLAIRYMIKEDKSLKASYARMHQYLHLVSGSSMALPTDLWYPVSSKVEPGQSDQVSVGYYQLWGNKKISMSAEAYYKEMNHLIEYREGAMLALNNKYEDELVHGRGKSYGLELMLSKTTGRLTGWVAYTLSRATRQFDSLNRGQEYDARYDRRHDLSIVGMFEITKRWSVSTSLLYATGNPFTGQTSQYVIPKPDLTGFEVIPSFTSRNALRLSPAFRIDLDIQYKFSISRRIKAEAHLSMYNVMNRTQPARVQRVWNEQRGEYVYQQRGLFGNITTLALHICL